MINDTVVFITVKQEATSNFKSNFKILWMYFYKSKFKLFHIKTCLDMLLNVWLRFGVK